MEENMRAKKLIFSGILITTAMLFFGSCGKPTEPANAQPAETIKEADAEENVARLEDAGNSTPAATEKPVVTAEPTQTPGPVATEKPAETAEPTQTPGPVATEKPAETAKPTQTPAPVATEKPTETAKPTQAPAPVATEKPAVTAEPTQTPAPVATEKPAVTAEPTQAPAPAVTETPVEEPNTEQPVETQEPVPPAQPSQPETPAQPEAPAHQHSWKDHVATTQTWIPNIVIVEDYGTIPGEAYAVAICSCGYETEDSSAISTHYKEGFMAGTCINFWEEIRYRESTTGVIGTHEEDQGHYETSSYVDYQYCDCGERK